MAAPTLQAYEVLPESEGGGIWVTWCERCNEWHGHSAGAGHRATNDPNCYRGGYNLEYAGPMPENLKRELYLPEAISTWARERLYGGTAQTAGGPSDAD